MIGSGIGGLAAAIRLAAKGFDVHVFEANERVGGKIQEHRAANFRFDLGPSIITLPHLLDELFDLHGKNPRDYFSYSKLEKPFKYFFPDGTAIQSYADLEKYGNELSEKTTDSVKSFRKYLKDVETKYKITRPVFIENSIHRIQDFFNNNVLLGVARFFKIDAFKSMNRANKRFFKDPKSVAIFNNFATYVGSNPFVAPGTLNVIQHLEINLGLYMPNKGIYSIVEALEKLAKEVGVTFHMKSRVDRIDYEKKKVTGVMAGGQFHAAHIVVSNMDVYFTFKNLLSHARQPKLILKQPKSNSIIGFYWGVNQKFPELEVHNMLFSKNQKEEFDTIFQQRTLYDDPSLYIYISSKFVPEDAPNGKGNWFVMVNVPNNQGQDWKQMVAHARINAIGKINKMLNTNIQDYIETEKVVDPVYIEKKYRSAFGAVYGNSSNNMFAAFLRHANFSRKIKNLYFVGGSVHPGAGVPMCLNSAKIMEKVMK